MTRAALAWLALLLACGGPPCAPPDVAALRSVEEAVGAAELALAPLAIACRHDDAAPTTWCRSYQGDELAEVFRRWGPAAVAGVAAHERGHSFGYVPEGLMMLLPYPELSADAWAGCALARLDLDPAPYLAVVRNLDAADYPDRARATAAGMEACDG